MHCPYNIYDVLYGIIITAVICCPTCLLIGFWNGLATPWRVDQLRNREIKLAKRYNGNRSKNRDLQDKKKVDRMLVPNVRKKSQSIFPLDRSR